MWKVMGGGGKRSRWRTGGAWAGAALVRQCAEEGGGEGDGVGEWVG